MCACTYCRLTADRDSCTHRHKEHIKDFLWRTQRTKSLWATNQRQEMEIKRNVQLILMCADVTTFQSHGGIRWTHNPLRESSHGFLDATSFYLKRKCSVPTPRSQNGLLIMWTHTRRAFITLCRCHPRLDNHTPSSHTLVIFKHPSH